MKSSRRSAHFPKANGKAGLKSVTLAATNPHSARAYRHHDAEQLYATICHNGKRTVNVPAEDWPAHRDHGDYRGPCRNRGVAGPSAAERPVPDYTATATRGNRDRLRASRDDYERRRAALPDTLVVHPD